jgi:hypothetical protein
MGHLSELIIGFIMLMHRISPLLKAKISHVSSITSFSDNTRESVLQTSIQPQDCHHSSHGRIIFLDPFRISEMNTGKKGSRSTCQLITNIPSDIQEHIQGTARAPSQGVFPPDSMSQPRHRGLVGWGGMSTTTLYQGISPMGTTSFQV